MDDICQAITSLLAYDPGKRRVPELACPQALSSAFDVVARSKRVILLSGFYIGRAGAWETDGPLGTLVLADAMLKSGAKPVIFTDEGAVPIFARGRDKLGIKLEVRGFSPGILAEPGMILRDYRPEALIAIERTGRAADGCYYNASGFDISQFVTHFDDLFLLAKQQGIPTIAVGDGGNELGFGSRWSEAAHLLGTADLTCITPADHLLPCGVSNWGGYALAALLYQHANQHGRLDEAELVKLLDEIVASGAIDGLSYAATPTVDGLPLQEELRVFRQIMQVGISAKRTAS